MKLWHFVQREKGAISIFMAVIMLSMFVLTSVFVDGSRIRSAETIVQSASDSAIRSVTAKYDKELKERYGLFTLKEAEQEKIQQDYLAFFTANLSANVPGADDSFHKYLDMIVQYVSGETDREILDLFDFEVSNDASSIMPVYSIIEPDVLQKQMVEFAKYRGALAVADLFDIGGTIQENIQKTKIDTANLKKTLKPRRNVEDVMEDVYQWAEDLKTEKTAYDKNRQGWYSNITLTQGRIGELAEVMEEIARLYAEIAAEEEKEDGDTTTLLEEMEKQKDEAEEIYSISSLSLKYYNQKKIIPLMKVLRDIKNRLEDAQKKVPDFLQKIASGKTSVTNSKNSLNHSGTQDVTENLENDADQMCDELDRLKEVVESNDQWLTKTIAQLEKALEKLEPLSAGIKQELAKAESESEAEANTTQLKKLETEAEKAATCFQQPTGIVKQYQFDSGGSLAGNLYQLYKSLKGSDLKTTNTIENPAIITQGQRSRLPSTVYTTSEDYHTNEKYKDMDEKYAELMQSNGIGSQNTNVNLEEISVENAEKTINIVESFLDVLGSMATEATNAVVTDIYTMGMFKARTTKTTDYWKEVYSKSVTKVEGERFDRKRSTEVDQNLRFEEKAHYSKANQNCFMDAELEYIITGNVNEEKSASSVYARVFGIRMGLNTIAVLADGELNQLSTAAASVAGPFAPLVKVAILLVLALVETYLDMYFLIDKGYKVALLKNNNLTLSMENLAEVISKLDADNMEKGVELFSVFQPVSKPGSIMIDYETYLYFLLLLIGRETKLLRMADLIQLNMQTLTGDDAYFMADHYTAIRAETEVTIKPMMMGLPFVPSDMKKDGRFKIRTMIYEGY